MNVDRLVSRNEQTRHEVLAVLREWQGVPLATLNERLGLKGYPKFRVEWALKVLDREGAIRIEHTRVYLVRRDNT